MSSNRLSQPPASYVRPPALPLVEMAVAVRLLPRLRCGACHARLAIEPPALLPGQLVCRDCGRRYNEIVERIAPTVSFADMERPKRGRPRSSNPQTAHAIRVAS